MSLEDLIRRTNEEKGAGGAGAWSTRINRELGIGSLYHYSTRMLQWELGNPGNPDVLDWSLGRGSVSDQQGMNKAFRVLGLPYYYSRSGGAEIIRHNNVRPSDAPLARR